MPFQDSNHTISRRNQRTFPWSFWLSQPPCQEKHMWTILQRCQSSQFPSQLRISKASEAKCLQLPPLQQNLAPNCRSFGCADSLRQKGPSETSALYLPQANLKLYRRSIGLRVIYLLIAKAGSAGQIMMILIVFMICTNCIHAIAFVANL